MKLLCFCFPPGVGGNGIVAELAALMPSDTDMSPPCSPGMPSSAKFTLGEVRPPYLTPTPVAALWLPAESRCLCLRNVFLVPDHLVVGVSN